MKSRFDRWWNIFAAFMLGALFLMTSLKIQSTEWTDDLHIINWLTFIGFLLGLGLGYSVFRRYILGLFFFLFSVLIVPYSIATTYESGIIWITRYESIYRRISFSIGQLVSNTRLEDPILFFTFLSILVWFTSLFGGFQFTRKSQPWFPILISGVTIFASEFYDQSGSSTYTAFFIFFVLLFLAQTFFLESNRNWRNKGIPVDFETESLIRRTAIFVSLFIVFFAWNVTIIASAFQKESVQQKKVAGIIVEIQNQFSKLTAPLQGTAYLQSEFYGDSVNLGTGSNLSDEVVFEIKVNDDKPPGTKYYWRARSYDQFLDGIWTSSVDSSQMVEANTDLQFFNENLNYPLRTFSIQTKTNLGLLYTPSNPRSANRPVKAFLTILPEDQADIIALALEEIAFSGETYEITNRVLNPTISQLRKTSEEYPGWVTDLYLQLPQDFSEKISDLALEITQEYTNPFDKTIAITRYLRTTINYNEQIPDPPEESDLIEWFLFEHKEGFCNYYATAEVLMLRSIGIPARIVFGYAQGEPQNEEETNFIVRREQSHAWPEVYFEGIGWIEFEPTTIQPSIDRLLGETSSSNNNDSFFLDPNRLDIPVMDGGESVGVGGNIDGIALPTEILPKIPVETPATTFIPFLIIGLLIFISLFIFARSKKSNLTQAPVVIETFLVDRGWKVPVWLKRWAEYSITSSEAKAFKRIKWSLFIFNQEIPISYTPAELVSEYKSLFPEMAIKADEMLIEYQKAIYSPHPIDLKLIQDNANQIFKYSINKKLRNYLLFNKRYS
jgi:transglutaminase-like putative cysteine protease